MTDEQLAEALAIAGQIEAELAATQADVREMRAIFDRIDARAHRRT